MFSMGMNLLGGNQQDSSSGALDFSNAFTMFKQLDSDQDGKITESGKDSPSIFGQTCLFNFILNFSDFVAIVSKMGLGVVGEQAVRQVFKQIDKNRNGKLDMSEAFNAFEKVKALFSKLQAMQPQ